jgi:hypothetical protein
MLHAMAAIVIDFDIRGMPDGYTVAHQEGGQSPPEGPRDGA